jgi:hypothetical protein
MQRPGLHRRSLFGAALIALTLALAVLVGCGGSDGDETAFTPVDGNESAYCNTYRGWQVHEFDGDFGDQPNPAAARAYWNEALIFLETSLHQAPPEIRDQLVVDVRANRTLITPLLEKYDFDVKRIEREGTAAEQALVFGEPPADVQKAQAAIHAYQDGVCQAGSPPAADVVFKADGSAKPFCTANSTFFSGFEKWASSRFDPDVLRTFVTADSFTDGLDALDATASVEIAADVKATTEWFRGRWSDVAADFDYDIGRILLDGTPEDRAVFTRFHPDVAEHYSRAAAYVEQVCTE